MRLRQAATVGMACLLLCVSLAGVGAGAVSTSQPTVTDAPTNESASGSTTEPTADAASSHPTIDVTYRTALTPDTAGEVTVTYVVELPSSVTEYRVTPPASVTSANGFTRSDGEWVWDGATASPTLTYDVSLPDGGTTGATNLDVGDWAFVSDAPVDAGARWRYAGEAPEYRESFAADGEGYATRGYVYLGAYTTSERTGSEAFVLVEPRAATPAADPTTVLSRLDRLGTQLDVGYRDGPVTVFVGPDPMPGGGQASGNAVWVGEDSALSTTGNTYYHEYVHTRQNLDYVGSTDMYWFVEASADYYAGYLGWEAGEVTTADFRRYVATDADASAVLTDQQPDDSFAEYTKGRRVLAALDIRIREATGGAKDLEGVFRELNGRDPSYGGFQDVVESVAGRSLDAWLDRYVTTSAVPSIPATDDIEAAYAGGATNEPPTAVAGPDRTVGSGATVTLDGSDSSDPDGDLLLHRWTQTGGPSVGLGDSTGETRTFTAPDVTATTTLTFELTVSDGSASDTETVTVTVEPGNAAPSADAGPDTTTAPSETVTLDGSASTDPDGDALDYQWAQTAGPAVSLDGADTARPSFTVPAVTSTTTLTFQLTVSDGRTTATDTVSVTVSPDGGTAGPLVVTTSDTTASPGDEAAFSVTVTNEGTGSRTVAVQTAGLPDDVALTAIESPGGTTAFDRGAVFWTDPLAPGETVRATYTLTVDAAVEPGTYTVPVRLDTADGSVVRKTATLTVAEPTVDPVVALAGTDGRYEFLEVLEAIELFNTGTPVANTGGRTLGFQDVLRIIERFNDR